MKTWEELVSEVEEVGFEKASAAARLAWSCETGRGIDQHAAPDLKELFGEIERLRTLLKKLEWAGSVDGFEACPSCGGVMIHAPDCELADALKP